MLLRLSAALLLASAVTASAQRGTAASQMAARAAANASQALDTASGTPGVYALPPDASPPAASPDPGAPQRIIRGHLTGTPSDPYLHYPYGRYQPTLGNVNPNSLANPFLRDAPGTVQPAPKQNPWDK